MTKHVECPWCLGAGEVPRTEDRPASEAWVSNYKTMEARVELMAGILNEFIYEATHLSPMNDDGTHTCRISANVLRRAQHAARAAKD